MKSDPFTVVKTVMTKGDGRVLAHVEIDFYPKVAHGWRVDTLGRQAPRCYIGGVEVDAETLNTALMICWVFAPMSDAGGIMFEESTRPLAEQRR